MYFPHELKRGDIWFQPWTWICFLFSWCSPKQWGCKPLSQPRKRRGWWYGRQFNTYSTLIQPVHAQWAGRHQGTLPRKCSRNNSDCPPICTHKTSRRLLLSNYRVIGIVRCGLQSTKVVRSRTIITFMVALCGQKGYSYLLKWPVCTIHSRQLLAIDPVFFVQYHMRLVFMAMQRPKGTSPPENFSLGASNRRMMRSTRSANQRSTAGKSYPKLRKNSTEVVWIH